jgi:hypothetical protein
MRASWVFQAFRGRTRKEDLVVGHGSAFKAPLKMLIPQTASSRKAPRLSLAGVAVGQLAFRAVVFDLLTALSLSSTAPMDGVVKWAACSN